VTGAEERATAAEARAAEFARASADAAAAAEARLATERRTAEEARRAADTRIEDAARAAATAEQELRSVRWTAAIREANARVATARVIELETTIENSQTASEARAAETERALRQAEALAAARQDELNEVAATLDNAREQLRILDNSTAWLATYPMRRMGRLLPNGTRRFLRRTARVAWWGLTLQAHRRLYGYWSARPSGDTLVPALPDGGAPEPTSFPAGIADTIQAEPHNVAARGPFWGDWLVVPYSHGPRGNLRLPTPRAPRVLIIDGRWPRWDRDSGSLDALLQARAFRDLGYEVVFVGEVEFADDSPYRDYLQREGITCLSPAICPSVESFLHSDGPTLTLCFLSRVYCGGRYLEAIRHHAPAATIVFNTVDLHHLREERAARLKADLVALRQAEATRERELYLVRQADASLVVSALERRLLESAVPGARVFELPLARPVRVKAQIPGFDRRANVGFVGVFDHEPNVDAVKFLISEIWPLVLEQVPEAELLIVGTDLPASVLAGAPSSVRYLGYVPDLDTWLDGLRLTVAPLRFGAGAKGKVASSLAAGVPCVGTPVAAEGMELRDGVEIAIGQSAAELAERISEIYRDPAVWSRLSQGGNAKAQDEFSVEAGERRLASMLDALRLPRQA
jgi:hypothetical protein